MTLLQLFLAAELSLCPRGQVAVEIEGPNICAPAACTTPLICEGTRCQRRDCTVCKPSITLACISRAEFDRSQKR